MTHTFSPAIYSSILLGKQIAASSDSPRHLSCLIPRSRARSRLYAALITSCVFYVLTLTDYFHSLFLCLHYDPYYFTLISPSFIVVITSLSSPFPHLFFILRSLFVQSAYSASIGRFVAFVYSVYLPYNNKIQPVLYNYTRLRSIYSNSNCPLILIHKSNLVCTATSVIVEMLLKL